MDKRYIRSVDLLTEDGIYKLNDKKVAVFGLGGVGSYAVEGLVRAGVKNLTLIDNDVYSESNLNRQLYATEKTVGKLKTEVTKNRILEIDSSSNVEIYNLTVLKDGLKDFDFKKFDYVLDAIDTVSGKVEIIKRAKEQNVNVISCMGAGNKLDATAFKVADIYSTKVCPLCKIMRKLLKEENVTSLKVVYSEEEPVTSKNSGELKGNRIAPSSVSFVPSVMGLIASGEIIKDLIK